MLIFTLAATMTLTMLIATAFGLRHEAQRVPVKRPDRQRPHR
ncbi:hypothetical protein [Chelativorans sp. M5D2P16]|nr:hypothetical protein [Chelativorans sp. M5D2P16]MDZ5696439.1 hypothetical protein [Chelativorans sp. M5D2P16]